jgi:type VI secretion system protein ImpA
MQSADTATPFLEPLSAAAPCGRDLDASFELYELENLVREPEEPGIEGVAATDTRDWKDIASKSQALLRTSKDLRLAVALARAWLKCDGIAGYARALAIVRGLVERYWDDGLFPALDPDDQDPQMRITALHELWGPPTLAQLRSTVVITNRELGSFTVNDVLAARNAPEARASAARAAPSHVLKALELAPQPTLRATHGTLCAALDDLEATARYLSTKQEGRSRIDPVHLVGSAEDRAHGRRRAGLLGRLADIVGAHMIADHPEHAGVAQPARADSTGELSVAGAASAASTNSEPRNGPMASTGEIRSREDVIRMLDLICHYYERFEPSSPVPLLMQRARALVTMSFMDIVRNMASNGLSQVELLAGVSETEAESD